MKRNCDYYVGYSYLSETPLHCCSVLVKQTRSTAAGVREPGVALCHSPDSGGPTLGVPAACVKVRVSSCLGACLSASLAGFSSLCVFNGMFLPGQGANSVENFPLADTRGHTQAYSKTDLINAIGK